MVDGVLRGGGSGSGESDGISLFTLLTACWVLVSLNMHSCYHGWQVVTTREFTLLES